MGSILYLKIIWNARFCRKITFEMFHKLLVSLTLRERGWGGTVLETYSEASVPVKRESNARSGKVIIIIISIIIMIII